MALKAWLVSSLHRQFALGKAGNQTSLVIDAARGERVSFQVGYRIDDTYPQEVGIEVAVRGDLHATARRVGGVPVPHHNTATPREHLDGWGMIPGYVPDILYPETTARAAPNEVNTFWVTVTVPTGAAKGAHTVNITLWYNGKKAAKLKATVRVAGLVLEPRNNFRICHWFYADALCDWYKVEPWSREFWPICERYMRNYAEHGLDTIYVPAFTPPTDGVKRPTQLLGVKKVAKDKYQFDWSRVKQWMKLANACGIMHWEWVHLFTQWGVKHAIRIYEGHGETEKLVLPADTGATSPTYRKFLSQFCDELYRFLAAEKQLDKSYFHLSDEPHGEEHLKNYRAARQLLREVAPWMKVMDALSDIQYGREGLTDIPIPSISTTKQYHDEGIASWTYYCCGPRGKYLNRLLDTPLAKIRMNGWLFYRFGVGGFLHWGYNYWHKSQTRQLIDPFTCTDGDFWHRGWAYGDTFVVYPGAPEVGPIDSIRWEVFAESLQDYRLLQTAGVDRNGQLLAKLKDFNDFPWTEKWINNARKKLLR